LQKPSLARPACGATLKRAFLFSRCFASGEPSDIPMRDAVAVPTADHRDRLPGPARRAAQDSGLAAQAAAVLFAGISSLQRRTGFLPIASSRRSTSSDDLPESSAGGCHPL